MLWGEWGWHLEAPPFFEEDHTGQVGLSPRSPGGARGLLLLAPRRGCGGGGPVLPGGAVLPWPRRSPLDGSMDVSTSCLARGHLLAPSSPRAWLLVAPDLFPGRAPPPPARAAAVQGILWGIYYAKKVLQPLVFYLNLYLKMRGFPKVDPHEAAGWSHEVIAAGEEQHSQLCSSRFHTSSPMESPKGCSGASSQPNLLDDVGASRALRGGRGGRPHSAWSLCYRRADVSTRLGPSGPHRPPGPTFWKLL